MVAMMRCQPRRSVVRSTGSGKAGTSITEASAVQGNHPWRRAAAASTPTRKRRGPRDDHVIDLTVADTSDDDDDGGDATRDDDALIRQAPISRSDFFHLFDDLGGDPSAAEEFLRRRGRRENFLGSNFIVDDYMAKLMKFRPGCAYVPCVAALDGDNGNNNNGTTNRNNSKRDFAHLSGMHKIFFPRKCGAHFILILYDNRNDTLESHNPSPGNGCYRGLEDQVKRFLSKIFFSGGKTFGVTRKRCRRLPRAAQGDSTSCAFYVCGYANLLSSGRPLDQLAAEGMTPLKMRRHVCTVLSRRCEEAV